MAADAPILFAAGVIAGGVNSVAGGGSLITFPEEQKAGSPLPDYVAPLLYLGCAIFLLNLSNIRQQCFPGQHMPVTETD
jgi:hypothetical protein